jgi:methylglyoxal/glyoxal reductase
MSPSDEIVLNNGVSIPRLGLGVYQSGRGRASENAVTWALEVGYRHVDTAAMYGNEMEVGAALKRAFATGLVRREEVFVTTKLWNSDAAVFDFSLGAEEMAMLDSFNEEYHVTWDPRTEP